MRQKNFIEMRSVKNGKDLFEEGRQREQAGQLEDAAAAYQQVVDADPGNRDAVGRLLVVYRKLKEYRKELAVVQAALSAVAERDKTAQQEWIRSHPGAAKIGMSVLRKLGGENASAFGTDPEVGKLLKRKAFLEKKIGGKQTQPAGGRRKTKKKTAAAPVRDRERDKKKAAATAAAARKEAAEKKRQEVAASRKAAAEKKREATEKKRREAAEQKQQAAAEKKAAREAARAQAQREKEAKAQPSLFVISLRYLVALERIDAAMQKHVAFLDKHFKSGDFLVSGRQEPRTGGIIIARAKNRAAVERIMRQDPFVKGRLASVDIVEFKASKTSKALSAGK